MTVRVLTWNLRHGRCRGPSKGENLDRFAALIASWDWDVALLQEVPPWWPDALAAELGASSHRVLTSRNALLPVRRAIARRRPDVLGANGGGCNAILARPEVREHRARRLRVWPERRWLQAVRLGEDLWVGNVHLSTSPARAASEACEAASSVLAWSSSGTTILGGDFNVRKLRLTHFEAVAAHEVDYMFVAGPRARGARAALLDGGELSDHAPVIAAVEI